MTIEEPQTRTRVALVTGAAQGIGEITALQLADDGLDIALNDLPEKQDQLAAVAKAVQAKGMRVSIVPGDISSNADVTSMISKAATDLGGLDVMVANAGIFALKSILDTEVEEWTHMLTTNALGAFLCVKYAARQMIKQGRGGRIICASSDMGKHGVPNAAAYSASKAAIRGLVQSAALEFREHGITVNAYCPGQIATPMVAHPDDHLNGGLGMTIKKLANLPLDPGDPAQVAGLVSYLAKPETSFITGQSISVNGGLVVN